MGYPSGERTVKLHSPWGRRNVKRIVRRSYSALSSSITTSLRTSDKIAFQVASVIRREIKGICSTQHESILRIKDEDIKQLNFQDVWTEFCQKMPTLMMILASISPTRRRNIPLLCLIGRMILKQRFGKMSFLQRAVSILLYGNGASKQVV